MTVQPPLVGNSDIIEYIKTASKPSYQNPPLALGPDVKISKFVLNPKKMHNCFLFKDWNFKDSSAIGKEPDNGSSVGNFPRCDVP